ncbi:50S ribosomal protein L6 [Lactovum miscens]|uniref:Large ribosomal subunit protein uL6 n=1 Tax=Lactovum miscens TaxID=190387 RepID=A0A841C7M3_9LACT|nr:50S ribosomal protein L6 [Lactovum miscens]MBB5888485.1 large subunit ribosomal protein L6 [Lactovum miscens]
MSRIGNKLVVIPAGVEVKQDGNVVTVKGPKGELTRTFVEQIKLNIEGAEATFTRPDDSKQSKALHGTTRALFQNMVLGVSEGFEKKLEMIGVGYRAQMSGTTLVLNVGKSHQDEVEAPEGIKLEVTDPTHITVSGSSKEAVGQVAANVRSRRSPEPYKGKGIRYVGEFVRRKEGKTGK